MHVLECYILLNDQNKANSEKALEKLMVMASTNVREGGGGHKGRERVTRGGRGSRGEGGGHEGREGVTRGGRGS